MSDAARGPGEQPGLGDPEDWARPSGTERYPAPDGVAGYEWPAPVPVARRSYWPRQAEIRWAVGVVLVLAVLGLAAGALWIQVAPRLPFEVVKPGEASPLRPESEVFVADDGWYFLITLAIGLVAGVLAWLPRAGRGALMPVALAAGGAAGALVTWVFGEWLAPMPGHDALQQVGATVLYQVRLKAQAAVVAEAFAAVIVYLILVGFSARDDLNNPDPRPAEATAAG
jgi:hypothetical protein